MDYDKYEAKKANNQVTLTKSVGDVDTQVTVFHKRWDSETGEQLSDKREEINLSEIKAEKERLEAQLAKINIFLADVENIKE